VESIVVGDIVGVTVGTFVGIVDGLTKNRKLRKKEKSQMNSCWKLTMLTDLWLEDLKDIRSEHWLPCPEDRHQIRSWSQSFSLQNLYFPKRNFLSTVPSLEIIIRQSNDHDSPTIKFLPLYKLRNSFSPAKTIPAREMACTNHRYFIFLLIDER
jgi:hypothetical protein